MTTEKFNFSQVLREADKRNESYKTSGRNNGEYFGHAKKGQTTPRKRKVYASW